MADLAVRRPTLDDVFLTLTGHAAAQNGDEEAGRMTSAAHDALLLASRNLKRIQRSPDMLVGVTFQPIMFVVLFTYVFGGAISTPGFTLHRLLPARDRDPDDRLHRLRDGAGDLRRPAQGPDRPLPLAADGPLGRDRRAHGERHRHEHDRADDDGRLRRDRRLQLPRAGLRDRRRLRARAAVRLRDVVGLLLHRADRVVARVGVGADHGRDLPADVRLVGLRPDGVDARR